MKWNDWFSGLFGSRRNSNNLSTGYSTGSSGQVSNSRGVVQTSVPVRPPIIVSQDEELARTAVNLANEMYNSWQMVSEKIYSEKYIACAKREQTESSLLALRSLTAKLLDLGTRLGFDAVDIRDPVHRIKSEAFERMTTNERNAVLLVMNLSSSIDSVKSKIVRITNERIVLVKAQPLNDEESEETPRVSAEIRDIHQDLDNMRFKLDDFLKFTIKIEKETAAYVGN